MRTRDEEHSAKFEKLLRGKRVDSCRYMTREEADQFGWYSRPLIIVFSDESYIILQSDDEGNDGGAALYEHAPDKDKHDIIYTI
jgi:hypothetical protein